MLNFGPSGSATAPARSMSAETAEHFGCGIWNLPHIKILSKEYPRATQLFLQGYPARDVFFVKRGLIKLVRLGENGQESIMGLRSKGALVGASSLIIREPHPLSAITTTQCLVFRIPEDVFLELAKTDPQFCWYLHQAHSRELHQQAYQLETLRCLSARKRFERLLWQFMISTSPHEGGHLNRVRLPLKNWEVAQLIGVTPEYFSRMLRQIQEEGVLHREDGCIVVSDLRRLYQPTDHSGFIDELT